MERNKAKIVADAFSVNLAHTTNQPSNQVQVSVTPSPSATFNSNTQFQYANPPFPTHGNGYRGGREEGLEIVAEAEVDVLGIVEVLLVRFVVTITTMLSIVNVVNM